MAGVCFLLRTNREEELATMMKESELAKALAALNCEIKILPPDDAPREVSISREQAPGSGSGNQSPAALGATFRTCVDPRPLLLHITASAVEWTAREARGEVL